MEEKKCNCNSKCTCGCQEGEPCTCEEETCGCQDGNACTCEECHCNDQDCNCENDSCECDDLGVEKKQKKDKKKKDHKKEQQITELEAKIQELTEKSLRDQAELINYRKRKDEEVSRMLKYSHEDLVREMLPIIDSFEQAIKMDDDNLEDEVSKFLAGFKMVYCNLLNVFEKYGIKPIDGAKKPFDATYHQAVLTEKVEGLESDQVIEVLQKGYLLKDKVIRPAMVKVSE